MRVAIFGHSQLAALWAICLRDHGRHQVVGYGLRPERLVDGEAARSWADNPIASAPRPSLAIAHADLAYEFSADRAPILRRLVYYSGRLVPIVFGSQERDDVAHHAAVTVERAPIVWNPLADTTSLDELASPAEVWIASDHDRARQTVADLWTPICNTVPVSQGRLSEAPSTGLSWPPTASEPSPGALTPPA